MFLKQSIFHSVASATIMLVAIFTFGCGGGGGGELSLNAQYENAAAISDPTARVNALLDVAVKQENARDSAGLDKSIATAEAAAESINDANGRSYALNLVAAKWADMGRSSEAKETLKKVRSSVEEIEDAESKAAVMTRLATIYGKQLGNKDIATVYLKNCNNDVISTIDRAEGKAEAMLAVALAYHEVGDAGEASAIVTAALEDIRGFAEPRDRADSLAIAAATLAKMGQADVSATNFEAAKTAIGEIADPLSQSYAWLNLAERYNEAGQKGAARSAIQKSQDAADKVPPGMQAALLDKIRLIRGIIR